MERMRLAASTASFANDFIMHCENNMDFAMETHEKWLLLVTILSATLPIASRLRGSSHAHHLAAGLWQT